MNKNTKRIYFPELDGLRFFAFLLVFLHHHGLFSKIPYISVLNTHGWIGVDLFFSLSAFLFTKLLVAEFNKTNRINFKKFYIRRIFRIWPIYFLFIVFNLMLYFYLLYKGSIEKVMSIRIISLLTFSDNIISVKYGYNPIAYTSHLWTIAYEEQFYIFIPVIILLLLRASSKIRLIYLITALIVFNLIRLSFVMGDNMPSLAIWVLPITHFEAIILGIVIGFSGLDFLLKKVHSLILAILAILLFIMLTFLPSIGHISYWLFITYPIIGISTSMLLFSVMNNNYLKKLFSNKLFVFLGKRSYGLYVYHLLGNGVAYYSIKYISILPSGEFYSFIYSLIFTIIASIISYEMIEKPFLKLKKKYEIINSRPI